MPRMLLTVGALGVASALVLALYQDWTFKNEGLMGMALLLLLGSGFVIAATDEGEEIRRSWWQTLTPYGCLLLVESIVSAALQSTSFTWIQEGPDLRFGPMALSLTVAMVTLMSAGMVFSIWMTGTVVEAARAGTPGTSLGEAIGPGFRRARKRLGAGAVAMTVGWSGSILILATCVSFGVYGIVLAIPLLLAWNVRTAALLPVSLAADTPVLASLVRGFETGKEWRSWALPVVLHQLLIGVAAYVSVTKYGPGQTTTTSEAYSVNMSWTGGFPDESYWWTRLVELHASGGAPMLELALGAALVLVAVAVRLCVARTATPKPD